MRTQLLVLGVALTVGCGGGEGGPTAPQQPIQNSANSFSPVVQAALSSNATTTHGVAMTCVAGPCDGAAGTVNFSAPARRVDGAQPGPGVVHEGTYTVHGAPPNTTYLLQRAVDFVPNGQCTGAFLTWPFPPFGPPSSEPPARLTTSAGGAGAAHFTFEFALGVPGVPAEIMFRLIEESPNQGGTIISTGCGPNF